MRASSIWQFILEPYWRRTGTVLESVVSLSDILGGVGEASSSESHVTQGQRGSRRVRTEPSRRPGAGLCGCPPSRGPHRLGTQGMLTKEGCTGYNPREGCLRAEGRGCVLVFARTPVPWRGPAYIALDYPTPTTSHRTQPQLPRSYARACKVAQGCAPYHRASGGSLQHDKCLANGLQSVGLPSCSCCA